MQHVAYMQFQDPNIGVSRGFQTAKILCTKLAYMQCRGYAVSGGSTVPSVVVFGTWQNQSTSFHGNCIYAPKVTSGFVYFSL